MSNTSAAERILFTSSLVRHGNLSFRWGEQNDVLAGRGKFLRENGLSLRDCVAMRVMHGADIAAVSEEDKGKGMSSEDGAFAVDCLITNKPDVALFLLTADCLPLAYFDPVLGSIGLAHISRKNAELGLPAKVIFELGKRYGSRSENVHIFAGPSIQQQSYILERPPKNKAAWGSFANTMADGATALDLKGFSFSQIKQAGVSKNNIQPSVVDTASSRDYFSHYRSIRVGEPEGRFATILMLR